MDRITEGKVLEVVQQIWMRSWGWPDGTQLCGMEAETVNQAMEYIRDRMENGWRNDPWPKKRRANDEP